MPEVIRRPPPEELRAEIDQSKAIGALLYDYDRASALGTDVMLANVLSPEELGIADYLTFVEADDHGKPMQSWLAWFFSADDPPTALCRVRVPMAPWATADFSLLDPPEGVPESLRRWVRARRTALAAIQPIVQLQNPVLLPGEAIGKSGILVYLIAGTTKPDLAVFGKHHRVLVSPDGNTVVSVEPLSNSILEIPLTEQGDQAGMWVTHTVTEWPLETHVFVSLLHGMPVHVVTSRGVWEVAGTEISLLAEVESSPRPSDVPGSTSAPPPTPVEPPPPKPWWRFW